MQGVTFSQCNCAWSYLLHTQDSPKCEAATHMISVHNSLMLCAAIESV